MSFDLDESREQLLIRESLAYDEDQERQTQPETDILVDVTNKLQEARLQARELNDKMFLYFIDTAIFHACEMLTNQSDLGEREKWN